MSGVISRRIAYVGHYAAFSGLLGEPPNRMNVENGVTILYGPTESVDNLTRYLEVMYQAYPEGSDAHQAALARLDAERLKAIAAHPPLPVLSAEVLPTTEQDHGSSALSPGASESDGKNDVPSTSGPVGVVVASGSPDGGDGAAQPAPGATDAGRATGDGSEDLVKGVPERQATDSPLPQVDAMKAARDQLLKDREEAAASAKALPNGEPAGDPPNAKLLRAIARLDPLNDEHWTQEGKPSVASVEKLYGSGDVTRKDIEAVASDLRRSNAPPLEAPV